MAPASAPAVQERKPVEQELSRISLRAAWEPAEELAILRATEQTRVVGEGSGVYLEAEARVEDLEGRPVGRYEALHVPGSFSGKSFEHAPFNLTELMAKPPSPGEPMDRPEGIPRVPWVGRTLLHFDLGRGSLVLVGALSGWVKRLGDGRLLLLTSGMCVAAGGDGEYEGAWGVACFTGSRVLDETPGLVPGVSFTSEILYTLRITTTRTRALLPEQGAVSPPLSLPERSVPFPGEDFLAGFGEETTEVRGGREGMYVVARGRTFDFGGRSVGRYLGSMPMTGTFDPQKLMERPTISTEGGLPELPLTGLLKVTFSFEGRENTVTAAGHGLAQLVPLRDGELLFMVAGNGVVSGGAGRYEGASGVLAVCGSGILSGGVARLAPGARIPFRTSYQLRLAPSSSTPSRSTVRPQASPSPLPDLPEGVDPETYKLEVVDELFHRIVDFPLIAPPSWTELVRVDGREVGFRLEPPLHRFSVEAEPTTPSGIRVANQAGAAPVADLRMECRFIPDDFVARPGVTPPAVVLDAERSQRFVIVEGEFRFRDGARSTVRVFGTGRTFPQISADRSRILLGMTLLVVETGGQLRGLPGMAVANGLLGLSAPSDFCFLIRLADPSGNLVIPTVPPLVRPIPNPDPDSTFLTFLGNNDTSDPTRLILDSQGQMVGAHLRQQQYFIRTGFEIGAAGIRAGSTTGPIVIRMRTRLDLNPSLPPPTPFTSENAVFAVFDPQERPVGSFVANIVEGRGFPTELPGAPTPIQRGAALAPIVHGSGIFEGVRGLITVVNFISIFPRQVSGFFLMRILDPEGRFRGVTA